MYVYVYYAHTCAWTARRRACECTCAIINVSLLSSSHTNLRHGSLLSSSHTNLSHEQCTCYSYAYTRICMYINLPLEWNGMRIERHAYIHARIGVVDIHAYIHVYIYIYIYIYVYIYIYIWYVNYIPLTSQCPTYQMHIYMCTHIYICKQYICALISAFCATHVVTDSVYARTHFLITLFMYICMYLCNTCREGCGIRAHTLFIIFFELCTLITYVYIYIRTYVRTGMHTYIHTYIHTYMHA
jgi:hypothetical protein